MNRPLLLAVDVCGCDGVHAVASALSAMTSNDFMHALPTSYKLHGQSDAVLDCLCCLGPSSACSETPSGHQGQPRMCVKKRAKKEPPRPYYVM